MNLRRIFDRISADKTIVFHSTSSKEELIDIVINNKFQAGRGGGKMLGPGFYANQHLYQAQKNNYGKYIMQAQIYGIRNFLFLEKGPYEAVFGPASNDFIYEQLQSKITSSSLLDSLKNIVHRSYGSTAGMATALWDSHGSQLTKVFGGFVYTGNFDKESVVCWHPERQVRPLSWSDDNGKTWKPAKELETYLDTDKNANLRKSESIRSLQRAKDLITKYANHPDEKLAKAIKSQLSRIADPAKLEQRKQTFIDVLQKERPSVVALI